MTELCEKCNIEIKLKNWSTHLKIQNHLENDPDQTAKPFVHTKLCEKCNVKVVRNAWDAHLKGQRHLTNLTIPENYAKYVI
jgi:hypothetical protein